MIFSHYNAKRYFYGLVEILLYVAKFLFLDNITTQGALTGMFMFVDIEQSAVVTKYPNKVKLFRVCAALARRAVIATRP